MCSFESIITDYDTIKLEISVLMVLVEKATTEKSFSNDGDGRNHKEEGEEEFISSSAKVNADDLRSIWTTIQHRLEGVKEEDEEMVKQEDKEYRTRKLGGLGTHSITVQSTISALESKVVSLETLLKSQAGAPPPEPEPTTPSFESLTQYCLTGKFSLKDSGHLYEESGHWNTNDSHLYIKSG